MTELYELNVTDRQTFIQFLHLVLRANLLQHPDTWENNTLPEFLEALAAYTEDIQGYYNNINANVDAEKPDWSTFADIFKGAIVYE